MAPSRAAWIMSVLTRSWRAASDHCSPAVSNSAMMTRKMRRRAKS